MFPLDQSSLSTSESTVFSCTRVLTISDHPMTGTAEQKAHQSTLHASCCADIENDMYIEELDNNDDEITDSNRKAWVAVYVQMLQEVDGNLKARLQCVILN